MTFEERTESIADSIEHSWMESISDSMFGTLVAAVQAGYRAGQEEMRERADRLAEKRGWVRSGGLTHFLPQEKTMDEDGIKDRVRGVKISGPVGSPVETAKSIILHEGIVWLDGDSRFTLKDPALVELAKAYLRALPLEGDDEETT